VYQIVIFAMKFPLLIKLQKVYMIVQVKIHSLKNTDSANINFTFTTEEQLQYSNRFAEGKNLYNLMYVAWLKVNYPEEDFNHFLSLVVYFPDAWCINCFRSSFSNFQCKHSVCWCTINVPFHNFHSNKYPKHSFNTQQNTQLMSPVTVSTVSSTLSTFQVQGLSPHPWQVQLQSTPPVQSQISQTQL